MKKLQSVSNLKNVRKEILSKREPNKLCIIISSGTCGRACGSQKVVEAIKNEIKKQNLEKKVNVRVTGCHGFCQVEPDLVIYPNEIFYQKLKPEDAKEIISKTVVNKKIVDRLLYVDVGRNEKVNSMRDIPFYKKQVRNLMANNVLVDPRCIDDYIAIGGYDALAKTLSKFTPKQIREEIKKSGLRGRGGGGFPTGRKWDSTHNAPGEPKYVIVNCDEGDPGAYMDRSVMEGNPHSVIEGLIIGAYAIGANDGYIYIREEYPLAIENTELAIKQAEEYGLLGKDILGSGFDFTIKIHRGAGAFVSGESSALMSAIEGKVGEPRPKYIHTSEKGLWDKPTCLNNVETWANVPFIINKGADWFGNMGTDNSKGTKIFSLVGNVNNTGLVEVPMGITLREIIYDIGGGIPNGKKFKAVQTGGPSGGCIPESQLDIPVDFDELNKVGSMMGSGGMIVMDNDTCMVDIARYFVKFLSQESCGKCTPCREGLRHMLRILDNTTAGKATEEDIKRLEELSEVVKEASLCALGQTAPNPVLSTLKYFRDEYDAHLQGECPAKVCKELIQYYIDPEQCKGCGLCLKKCPVGAISGEKKGVHTIDVGKCIKCGACFEVCKLDAVSKISGEDRK